MIWRSESESFGFEFGLFLFVFELDLFGFSEGEGGTSWAGGEEVGEGGFGFEKGETDIGELTVERDV